MGVWDEYQEEDDGKPGFVNLGDGESFTGRLVSVEPRTIAAGTFSHQPNDLKVPRLTFDANGRSMILDATTTVLRNALVEKSPLIGDMLTITRKGKPKGKAWVDWSVQVESGSEPVRATAPEPVVTKPVEDDEPPF